MADITNPEAVKFCNEKARVLADLFSQLYYFAKGVKQEWDANNLGALLPVSADPVIDGSATDGRHPITGNDVQGVINRATAFITDMEANSNQNLNAILNVAVNTQR